MGLITRAQKQKLVYWPATGNNTNGEPTYGAPVEYTCRWEEKTQELILPSNTRTISQHYLITQARLQSPGIVWLGELASCPYLSSPKDNTGAYEVLASAATPNLRNTETLYEAWA